MRRGGRGGSLAPKVRRGGRGGSLAPKVLRAAYTPPGLGDIGGAVADTKALAKPLYRMFLKSVDASRNFGNAQLCVKRL